MSPDSRRGLLCSVRLIWTDPADGPACGGETLLPKVLFAALLLPVFSACGHRGRLLSPRAQAGVWTAPGKKVSMAPALQRNQTCTELNQQQTTALSLLRRRLSAFLHFQMWFTEAGMNMNKVLQKCFRQHLLNVSNLLIWNGPESWPCGIPPSVES